jgi:hypothetical protein
LTFLSSLPRGFQIRSTTTLFLSSAVFIGAGNVLDFVDSGPAVGAGVWVLSLGVAVLAPAEALGADSLGPAEPLGADSLGAV